MMQDGSSPSFSTVGCHGVANSTTYEIWWNQQEVQRDCALSFALQLGLEVLCGRAVLGKLQRDGVTSRVATYLALTQSDLLQLSTQSRLNYA